MRPITRRPVNKQRSSGQFRRQVGRTKRANIPGVMRGGYRL